MKKADVTDVPKYERVKRQLIREIESGSRASGAPFPSERELLQQFGVSRPTLVRSLQELVREGYLVRKQGKGTFVATRSGDRNGDPVDADSNVAVFLSRHVAGMTGAGREVQLRILRGIQSALGATSRVSSIRQASTGKIDDDTRRFAENNVGGTALIVEPSFCPALPHYLLDHGWAVWSVNEPLDGINSVRIDQEHAGYLGTRFLLDQGCKRIALLNGPTEAYWGFGARLRGYVRALTDAGMDIDEQLTLEDAHAIDSEAGRTMMRMLLDRNVEVDGVVGASDSKAIGAMACAAEHGLRIPEEIVFVSIDNVLACEAEFPLPAVAMPFEEMGFQAALQARSVSSGRGHRDSRPQIEVILRPTLVER
jgi:GntR family transcriptional regulator of arabinose operon